MQALEKRVPELGDVEELCTEKSCKPVLVLITHVSELTDVVRSLAASNAEMAGMTLGFRAEVGSLTAVVKRIADAEEKRLERQEALAAAVRKPLLDWAVKLTLGALSMQTILQGFHWLWH
jgi:hypothetical protein